MSSAAVTEAPRENTPELMSRRGRTIRMPLAHKILGESLQKALQDQAQLTTVIEADVTTLTLLRNRAEVSCAAREGFGLTALPFFVLAAAQALKTHPVVIARFNVADGTVAYLDTREHRHRRRHRQGAGAPGRHGSRRADRHGRRAGDRRAGYQGSPRRPPP
ncbi:2-oxo acid dehydrogenase subunit E2 [Streptomyces sp. NPDC048665]|uniref:2-oxo acid dehydrogenase subunit E2 n=1 Tax=Streptomyces sp. NPDC048665 TaxID=3155490 RepID=UPI003437910C